MTELVLVKTPGGALAPADEEARALVEKLKAGQGVRATIKRVEFLVQCLIAHLPSSCR